MRDKLILNLIQDELENHIKDTETVVEVSESIYDKLVDIGIIEEGDKE